MTVRISMNDKLVRCFFFVCAACTLVHAKVIDTIKIEGLVNESRQTMIRGQVPANSGDEFDLEKIQKGIKNLYRLGLFKTVNFYVENETDSTVSLLLRIEEYPVVESIEFSGNRKLKKDDFEEVLTVSEGQALTNSLEHENITALKDLYAEKGYLLADVSLEKVESKVPGNVIARFKFREGKKVRVDEITFKGNEAFTDRKLKRKFKTKERRFLFGGDFSVEDYRSHLDSLVLFYNNEGYLDAEIVSDSFWYGEDKKDIYIAVELDEGKKYYTGDFFFTGNKVLEKYQLEAQVAMKKGKPFNKTKFDYTKESVISRYREEGYLWVQVKDRRRFRKDTIDVTFEIVEGIPAIVRKIDIVGNEKTREKVIRRKIRLMPGRKYKQSLMMRSVRDIMQLNYFDNVAPDLKPNEDGTVDFVFDITEKENIGQLQLGAAYSQVDGFVGTFSTSIPNFRGAGQKLDLAIEYGRRRQHFSAGFTEPWAFDTPTRLSGSLFFSQSIYTNNDTLRSYGATVGVGRELNWPDDYFYASTSLRLSKEEEFGENLYLYESDRLRVLREGILSRLSFSLKRDDTDMPMFPSRGSIIYVSPEIAVGRRYEDFIFFNYLKGTVGIDNYFPLFWKFVLGTRFKFGLIEPIGDSPRIISRYDLFSGGGVYGVDAVIRGYQEFEFGGRYNYFDEDGIAMMSLTSEIRFPILEQQLYLAAFGDLGNTWSSLEEVDVADMYPGVGLGFRLMVPMLGLIGFDFGWGLADPDDKDRHFSNNLQPKVQTHFIMNRGF
ncbi:MAG: outer membrane protein assembly factor BamA [Chitinivibrionales bacterium]|nr:outer membrane protein assembly factor BamA [Chitinivibrionales bacterium]